MAKAAARDRGLGGRDGSHSQCSGMNEQLFVFAKFPRITSVLLQSVSDVILQIQICN